MDQSMLNRMEQFARNTMEGLESGKEEMSADRIKTIAMAQAEMLLTLVTHARTQQTLCAAHIEAAEMVPVLLKRLNLTTGLMH